MYSLRIRHAKQVVLVCNNKERLLTGESMKNLAILEGGLDRGVSIVVNNAGKIECVDFDDKVDQDYPNCTFEEEVDASGMCVVPGKTNSFHKINDKVRNKQVRRAWVTRDGENFVVVLLRGSTPEEATDNVVNYQIPKLQELMKNEEINVDNIDVFCEKGVFGLDETRRILEAGKAAGLALNFHGDELHPMKAAELGAELGARAISHLEEVSDEGIQAMSAASVIAVLLPTTAYILRLKCPPARAMINSGVPVALGSDFNPNAFCLSMPLTMHLACVNLHMTMEESLVAATINAAASLGRSHTHGSLESGKVADMLVIDAPRWEHLVYQLGGHDNVIKFVIKNGKIVHRKPY
ncbi:probable imidazolonepropionase [Orbicella faveolata]|uniref:probable imidazolonepropionase n=1 Tax=Orbicella faveolata TaxID=48498 RepID=UPI0009E5E3F6|nr:probable imidazolonepropionase [Orbicella faveolata]